MDADPKSPLQDGRSPALHEAPCSISSVVMFSSGISSWAAGKRWAEMHGTDGMRLLFADTGIEDEDNYRFLHEAADNIGAPLIILKDGRDPFQVMRDERIIGNSMFDPCSKLLKRKLLLEWEKKNILPSTPKIFGLLWDESHRLERMQKHDPTKNYVAPLCEKPWVSKADTLRWAKAEGIEPPRMYAMGFPHANCGGFCVKAGQATFRILLREFPERFHAAEVWELEMQEYLNTDMTVLKRTVKGERHNMTLREFRERVEADESSYDQFDFGGCACALPS
jgi:3'-phosphoadenosine 5'-phosphosulfate sulfotransferase (PAPS reductase)/FAD synthetase